jgi:hypothetical protein
MGFTAKYIYNDADADADDEKADKNIIDTYYSNFSNYALTLNKTNCKNVELFSYSEWKSDPTKIEKTSLNILKHTLKSHGKPVSGKKKELINRLRFYYMQIRYTIKIQSTFRGFLVRESERMRGPASKTHTDCNNETDFNTMELFDDFPRELFFSYKDSNGFIYGFNILSLMSMFKKFRKLVNPYNREDIPFEIMQNMFSLYKKIQILYPDKAIYI